MKALTSEQVCDPAELDRLAPFLEEEGPITMTLDGKVVALVSPAEVPALRIRPYRTPDEVAVIELGFYRQLGYSQDEVVSLGKRLIDCTAGRPG